MAENIKKTKSDEIDLIEIVRGLWIKRKFILKATLLFALLGILVALFTPKEYTAHCVIVPQTGDKNAMDGLGSLAAIAGISFGSMVDNEILSPKIYPRVLASVPFQKELMQEPIRFQDYEQPVRLIDYYTDRRYRKFSLLGTVKKYTIGLPGLMLKAFRGEQPALAVPEEGKNNIQTLSKKETECMDIFKNKILININEKEGIVNLSGRMPEPFAAAQLTSRVQSLLQRYITEFKIEKAKAKLNFIEERYNEAKKQFETKQKELASFRDANRNFASEVAKTTEERLSNEYTVALGVYSELAKQKEQANIQVKEDTPMFTIVEPVTVPIERSKPRRAFLIAGFTFLGFFLATGLVFVLIFANQAAENKRLQSWLSRS